ncbi:hypothetical protein [Formosa sp. S-31]|uniref:hypothetical protein n=1 Tax=Formosa sp. S-31 TaxID=2790949 RepID=UPI003EBC7EFA
MKSLQTGLLNYITSKICNFKSLDTITFLEDESTPQYQCYKLSYYSEPSGFHVCRLEVNFDKNKFSIGKEGDSFFGTFKFSPADFNTKTAKTCCATTNEDFGLFC